MQTIKIQLDTKNLQDNTVDNTPIEITTEETKNEVTIGDVSVKGTDMTVSSKETVYLVNLKNRISEIDSELARIDALQTEKAELETKIIDIQKEVDKQVNELISKGEVTDNRTK